MTNPQNAFNAEWGKFRRWLSEHPLTGFWAALGGGLVIGAILF